MKPNPTTQHPPSAEQTRRHSNTKAARLTLGLLSVVTAGPVTAPAVEAGPPLQVGLAVCDVTPSMPIWLAGYAARNRPSERVDTPLLAQACALKSGGETVVLVSLDNCEVSRDFMAPVLDNLADKHGLPRGRVITVSSHTHSAPVLDGPLWPMYQLGAQDAERVRQYSESLKRKLADVVGAALEDFQPATLEHGVARATFAMNRRIYRDDGVSFGENLEGPVDHDVPVLRIKGTNDTLRAILFGYACHGTSIQGDDFYVVCGDYMGYARQHIEAHYPGVMAMYLTGMGADSNPAPRGTLLDAKRHGLELAGAVVGCLDRPMRPVKGDLRFSFAELDLPLAPPPTREQLETDARSENVYIRNRATAYLRLLDAGKPLPQSVKLPIGVVRVGDGLTFVAMGGEVVVDYARKFKRLLAHDHPWLIGYAYEVPCYIPSVRILKEGGYEADSSLIYYGLYGPFQGSVERLVVTQASELVAGLRGP